MQDFERTMRLAYPVGTRGTQATFLLPYSMETAIRGQFV